MKTEKASEPEQYIDFLFYIFYHIYSRTLLILLYRHYEIRISYVSGFYICLDRINGCLYRYNIYFAEKCSSVIIKITKHNKIRNYNIRSQLAGIYGVYAMYHKGLLTDLIIRAVIDIVLVILSYYLSESLIKRLFHYQK